MFDNLPLWPTSASVHARYEDWLFIFLTVVSVAMTVLIFAAVAIFSMKYRRRHGREATHIEGSLLLEIGWSIAPLGIMLVMFAAGALLYFSMRTPPTDSDQVYVVAKQWMWKLQHMEGPREINQLHVPVGRDIELIMTSQDVIHSFYVPAFRVKQDVIPGRYTTLWFRATRPGDLSSFLRPVLRDHALWNDRRSSGDGPAGLPCLDGNCGAQRHAGANRNDIISAVRMQHLPPY